MPFKLTFAQWWSIWTASGHWTKRGNSRGKYCMCRTGDAGAYEIGNVYIGTWSHNVATRNQVVAAVKRHTARTMTVTFVSKDGSQMTREIVGDEVPF